MTALLLSHPLQHHDRSDSALTTGALDGARVLVLEDEFLIAMDVEQLCRDHGAADVVIARGLAEIDGQSLPSRFDAAVVDLMLGEVSTLGFAAQLRGAGIPFVFASGYSDSEELRAAF